MARVLVVSGRAGSGAGTGAGSVGSTTIGVGSEVVVEIITLGVASTVPVVTPVDAVGGGDSVFRRLGSEEAGSASGAPAPASTLLSLFGISSPSLPLSSVAGVGAGAGWGSFSIALARRAPCSGCANTTLALGGVLRDLPVRLSSDGWRRTVGFALEWLWRRDELIGRGDGGEGKGGVARA